MIGILDSEAKHVSFFGRTLFDPNTKAVFFNWSGSGFEFVFEGKQLAVYLSALDTVFPPEGTLWPWISIFVDDMEKPVAEIEIDRTEKTVTLIADETVHKHAVRVVKRSENDKGKVGITGFEMEGKIVPPQLHGDKLRLEFIGDSITCGFGNEARKRDDRFLTGEENGLTAYCAIAARLLGAEYHNISVSGIPLCRPLDSELKLVFPGFPDLDIKIKAMEDYYEFTDRLHEEMRGRRTDFTKWDFERFKPDAIVINLGTNDSYIIKSSRDRADEERNFEARYKAFIRKIRELNGPQPVIGCTLGSMDYYLYDNILRAVEAHRADTGDARIFSYKFGGIFPLSEGYGAQDHPSALTHERMGRELGTVLKGWLRSHET